MTNVVEYVQRHRDEFEDFEYLQQFEPDADGLRLNDEMAFYRMQELLDGEAVWDDIGSERKMREYATTDILEGTLDRDRFARGLGTDELNDLVNYNAWSVYAWLALRATEGKSEIIPRQEYELLASCWIALRYPEFHKLLLETIGLDGVIDIGVDSRKELGTAVCPLVSWSNFVVPGMGYIGLNELDHIDVDDPAIVNKERTAYTVSTALSYGCRGEDGYALSTQNRYVNDAKDESVVQFVDEHLEGLDTDDERTFRQFNAAVELLSFLLH